MKQNSTRQILCNTYSILCNITYLNPEQSLKHSHKQRVPSTSGRNLYKLYNQSTKRAGWLFGSAHCLFHNKGHTIE